MDIPLLKLNTVKRAMDALIFCSKLDKLPKGEREGEEEKAGKLPSSFPTKPCFSCKYYTNDFVCIYPWNLFKVYTELKDFDRDFAEG